MMKLKEKWFLFSKLQDTMLRKVLLCFLCYLKKRKWLLAHSFMLDYVQLLSVVFCIFSIAVFICRWLLTCLNNWMRRLWSSRFLVHSKLTHASCFTKWSIRILFRVIRCYIVLAYIFVKVLLRCIAN